MNKYQVYDKVGMPHLIEADLLHIGDGSITFTINDGEPNWWDKLKTSSGKPMRLVAHFSQPISVTLLSN